MNIKDFKVFLIMKEKVLLSIIIPHHNIPDLLKRCIDSIPDIESIQVIVVDDNSDSKIVDFEHFPGKNRNNTMFFFTKEGRGAGYARNVGLEHAKGQWLLFADSDDYFVKGFYDIVFSFFESEHDQILFKADSVDSESLQPSNRCENINKRIDDVLNGRLTALEASLAVHSPWCRLIKRSLVFNNIIKFDEVISSNDTMFTTKVGCLSKSIGFSSDVIYVVTHRSGSLWETRKKNPKNYLSRLEVQINRNNYVTKFRQPQSIVLLYALEARHISLKLMFESLWIIIRKRALFQGVGHWLTCKIRNK